MNEAVQKIGIERIDEMFDGISASDVKEEPFVVSEELQGFDGEGDSLDDIEVRELTDGLDAGLRNFVKGGREARNSVDFFIVEELLDALKGAEMPDEGERNIGAQRGAAF